jgi:hypothetical protein
MSNTKGELVSKEALHIGDVMPCFVYYWKKKNNGRVQRIGFAEHFVGTQVMVRESSYSRDMYKIEDLEILEVNKV